MTVKILRWPTESALRERLSALGIPRVLIMEENCDPPAADAMEDLIEFPASADELMQRVRAMQAIALSGAPVLESNGILHFGGQRTHLSRSNAAVMRVLLDNSPSLVRRTDLIRLVWPDAGPTRNAVDLRLLRLRQRIAHMGLAIQTVRNCGYLLETGESPLLS